MPHLTPAEMWLTANPVGDSAEEEPISGGQRLQLLMTKKCAFVYVCVLSKKCKWDYKLSREKGRGREGGSGCTTLQYFYTLRGYHTPGAGREVRKG